MSPIPLSSFEDAIRCSQTTAPSFRKSSANLDEMLRAVNGLVLRSYGDEISVPVPLKDATFATHSGRSQGSPVDGFGIHRFEYRANDEGPPRQELAVGLRYTTSRKDTKSGDDLQIVNWVPLVPLAGPGAPRPASRRLRLWAGQNLPYLIGLLSGVLVEEVQKVAAAAKQVQKAKVTAGSR